MDREKTSAEQFAAEHNERNAAKLGVTFDELASKAAIPETAGKQLPMVPEACAKLERQPTISRGMKALGLQSMAEIPDKRVHLIDSPFTDELQRPYAFIPGVPAHPFYDPAEFEWVRTLEAGFPAIKKEFLALLEDENGGFKVYKNEWGFVHANWNTFNFFVAGEKVEANCARCPETTRVIESLPRFERDHIMFSALNPKSHLAPHVGPLNGILRAHLPLLTPKGCEMKVGNEAREWEEGKVMVFDDSFVHSAWNPTNELRAVLFLNLWHPCFEESEIPALEEFRKALQMFSASWKVAQNEDRLSGIKKEDRG